MKQKPFLLFFLCLAVLTAFLVLPGPANAALVFQRTVFGGGSSGPADGSPDSAILSLGIETPANPVLFETQLLSPASVGQTFTADAASDPDFNDFVAAITDGSFSIGELIRMRLEFPGLGASINGFTEPNFFFNDGSGASGIDLIGFNIDSISMRIDQWDTPGTFPGAGSSSDVAYTATLSFDGSPIPEPSRAMLSAIALGSAVFFSSRRRRRS